MLLLLNLIWMKKRLICEIYLRGKITHILFSKGSMKNMIPLEIIHIDLYDPMRI